MGVAESRKPRKGAAFVISAPSGAGKSTLINLLMKRIEGLAFSVSHTTRPPRGEEQDGVQYHFVDRGQFEAMISRNEFIEWAEVHGNLYGTSIREIEEKLLGGIDLILDIDVQGALQVADKIDLPVLIFILPPSMEELKKRIETRGLDDPVEIDKRLKNAAGEIEKIFEYDYVIVNDDLQRAVDQVAAVVAAERLKVSRQGGRLSDFLTTS